MRKRFPIYLTLIILLLASLVSTFVGAYLTDQKGDEKELTIGEVGVFDVKVYYMNGATEVEYEEVTIQTQTKHGVYEVNIIDPSQLNYITNLRVDFYITSNVDSYLRVKINDQIVRKTENYSGVVTETALRHAPTYFNINSTWHIEEDPKDVKNTYYYYPQKIKKITADPLKVSFIIPYAAGEEFNAYSMGHSLQLGIVYDLVQANHGGPLNNWGLANPPWGGVW